MKMTAMLALVLIVMLTVGSFSARAESGIDYMALVNKLNSLPEG